MTNNGGNKTLKAILPVILVAAFVLRLKSIWFGYPLQLHPDEPVIVQSALNMIRTGDLNPHNFLYPSLTIYLNALLYKLGAAVEQIALGVPAGAIPEIDFHLFGRALNVVFATATIYVVYQIGKRLFGSWTGIAAACFISASSLHVDNSYFVTVDIGMAFWTTLACLTAVLIHTRGARTGYYLAGGVFAGFAIGCKYTAFPAFLPILVAHLCRPRTGRNPVDPKIVLALAAVPAAFLLTTPYAILDYPAFSAALAYQKAVYSLGHTGAESPFGFSLWAYCRHLGQGYGLLPLLLALAGAVVMYRENWSALLLLLSCPLVLLLFLGMYKVHFPRNVVTLVPFLAVLSGYAAVKASGWVGQRLQQPVLGRIAFAGGGLLVAVSLQGQLLSDLKTMTSNSLPDTRWVSLLWSRDNIPAGANVGREYYTPPLEGYSARHSVSPLGNFGLFRNREMIHYLDYVITSSADYSRFLDNPGTYPLEASVYREFFARHQLIKEFSGDGRSMTGPTIRIYQIRRN